MDDELEKPAPIDPKFPKTHGDHSSQADEGDQSSDDEDGGPDWTKLSSALASSAARPVIPKRGEKDHEPAQGGETRLQSHVLDQARTAMFNALRTDRGASSKSMTHAIWYPSLARAHVAVARGIHFATLGHYARRSNFGTSNQGENAVGTRRLELLPEEALYLIERGVLLCSMPAQQGPPDIVVESDDTTRPPMSVQHAYSEMIGKEALTLEKYQVYAYLKRLGYVVTRSDPPSPDYPTPSSALATVSSDSSVARPRVGPKELLLFPWRILRILITGTVASIGLGPRSRGFDWWQPWHTYSSGTLFSYLRGIPVVHGPAVTASPSKTKSSTSNTPEAPYRVFYNLYKPATPFRKSAPADPDFQVVVVNAQETPMPTLHELTLLFDTLPELPPPTPRKRVTPGNGSVSTNIATGADPEPQSKPKSVSFQPTVNDQNAAGPTNGPPLSAFQRFYSLLSSWFYLQTTSPATSAPAPRPPQRPNPFPILKQGKKMIVIAVVDSGSVGFFRFGPGVFEEWPMA